ncbi:hypothetical protein HY345_04265 [Candidatus Microgenomates bacterium]|nr:hypothetical protein [Candidatus Microgenomates bacterium]
MACFFILLSSFAFASEKTSFKSSSNFPNYAKLADAIRKAEGNPNYGVLKKFKHTSPRQACINTCRHAFKDFQSQSKEKDFLKFLQKRYAPIGALNDPGDLNTNWERNVRFFYEKI